MYNSTDNDEKNSKKNNLPTIGGSFFPIKNVNCY